jgi:hypothetical protein
MQQEIKIKNIAANLLLYAAVKMQKIKKLSSASFRQQLLSSFSDNTERTCFANEQQ